MCIPSAGVSVRRAHAALSIRILGSSLTHETESPSGQHVAWTEDPKLRRHGPCRVRAIEGSVPASLPAREDCTRGPQAPPTWKVQERSCSPSCRSWSTGVWTLTRFSLVSAATGKERTTTCSPTGTGRVRSQRE